MEKNMLLVEGNKISFKYDEQTELLLREVSFTINNKSKIGLVGDNGCGKSTLFKLILGNSKIYTGVLKKMHDVSIGYLPQEVVVGEEITVEDYLWGARKDLKLIKDKMLSVDMNSESNYYLYSDFSDLGGYGLEVEIQKILSRFGLDEEILGQAVMSLSGGEKTKIALSQLLLSGADLILFDEPTNNLDIESLNWLENYLKGSRTPFVVISHDRTFLDNCVSEIWELSGGKVRKFSGNYSYYKKELEIEFQNMMEKYEKQQKKIKQLTVASAQRRNDANKMENFKHSRSIKKNGGICKRDEGSGSSKADPTKKMRSAKAVEKRVELMLEKEKADKPKVEKKREIKLDVDSSLKSSYCFEVKGLEKSYSKKIFSELNLIVPSHSRVAIAGPNGSGKTTFLRSLIGIESVDSGEIRLPPTLKMSYFAQNYENLDYDLSIIEAVIGTDLNYQTQARTILGCLGLKKDKVYQKVGTLSSGERSKVSLTKSILSGANLLVLDEPTNHLEVKAKEAVENALLNFDGSVIFVSHDRRFIENVATHIFDMESKTLFESLEEYSLVGASGGGSLV